MSEPAAPSPPDAPRDAGRVASGGGAQWPAHAIAVVGMAGRFPGAADLESFWQQVAAGTEVLETLSEADLDAAGVSLSDRAHPHYVRRGSFLARCDEFDAGFFGYAPREAQVLDPQHRVFLECAWEALEHAGYAPGSGALPDAVGVYAGASMNTYVHAQIMRNPALAEAVGGYQLMLANDKDYLCTRVSYKLGLKGPSMSVQTACSTSLVAVQVACRAVQRGECDMALAGGVSILFPQRAGYLYQEGMILSPDARCRPFDAAAQGTRAGAGAGVVVLKRLDQALADGDTVHAVIRGIAVNNDGADKAGFTAPSIEGQVEVIATAQALAGVPARSISYVEAHGTATPLGDPIEVAALSQVFSAEGAADHGRDERHCRLGSLKAQLGHLDAAAGVAGLIKTVLALSHRELPPLANFERPNPALQLERSAFYVSAEKAAWIPPAGLPRRAGVSSFGIGGTNAHAVLEEAPPPLPREVPAGPYLLVWSARSASALEAASRRLATHLQNHPEQALADVAYTLQVGRRAFAHRRAIVAGSREECIAAVTNAGPGAVLGARHEGGARPVAFLFSGQGSQHSAMGRGLYESEPTYRAAVDHCAQLLQPLLDADIRALMFEPGHAAALDTTRITQPALFVTEYALAMCWRARGVQPVAMLGHSIGEYVAAHLAGVMTLPDALAVVCARGALMQQQPPGRMAAVHLSAQETDRWLDSSSSGLEIAAVNAPGLCTVSGPVAAIEALLVRLHGAGVQTRALQTSHAFHSAMMTAALAPFEALMRRIALAAPQQRWLSNLTGTWITPAQAMSPNYWVEHLRRPVLFEAALRTLLAEVPTVQLLEVGPGQALTALARLTLADSLAGGRDRHAQGTTGADTLEAAARVLPSMRRPTDSRPDAQVLLDASARLWLAGCALDWHGLHAARDGATPRLRRVPLPTYPFERQRYAVDPLVSPASAANPGAAPRPDGEAAPSARARAAVARSSQVDDWFYAPTWSRDDAVPQASSGGAQGAAGSAGTGSVAGSRWLVLGHDDALSEALCAEMAHRGHTLLRAEAGAAFEAIGPACWHVRPDAADDLRRLLSEACREAPLAGIVHLWALRGREVRSMVSEAAAAAEAKAQPPLAAYEPAFDGLVAIACAVPDLAPGTTLTLLHASLGAESVLGELVAEPTQALACGPVLVLPREIDGLRMRAVDFEAGALGTPAGMARIAITLADEAQLAATEPQVAYRAGLRWVRRYERLVLPKSAPVRAPASAPVLASAPASSPASASRPTLPAPPSPLRTHGHYLITGGLGGMGLAVARWLGLTLQARLVLTSRQRLPPRDEWDPWLAREAGSGSQGEPAGNGQGPGSAHPHALAMQTIREIEAAGGAVCVVAADTADEAGMRAALAEAQGRFGAMHGVFHAAGIAGRGSLARRARPEDARAVLAPKWGGLQVLCTLLGEAPLDLVVLMSSINAALPAPGVCDYASANALLDAFVDSRQRPAPWRHVVAIDWGAWREVGMAARLTVPEALRAHWQAHLAGAIGSAAGIEALARVLASQRRRVVVETYDVVHTHELLRQPAAPALADGTGMGAGLSAHGDIAASAQATPSAAGERASGGDVASPNAPGATGTRPALSTPHAGATCAAERRLSAIWEELLGVRGIGIDDDFFELGGHSLMFTRVLALVEEGFGTRLPLREVFDATTIRQLAARLPPDTLPAAQAEAAAGAPSSAATPNGDAGAAPAREVLEL